MDRCPRCQGLFSRESGFCQNCGYRSDGQFPLGNDQTRLVGQNGAGASASPVGSGQPMGSPVPPSAPVPPVPPSASFAPGSDSSSWQNSVYSGVNPGQSGGAPSYYPASPNGGSTDGDGGLPEKWYRNKKNLLTVIIGAVAAIALVSGIAWAVSGSPKPKPTAASSPSSETSSETPTPEVTQVDLPATFAAGDKTVDSKWQWQGGAMVTKIYSHGEQENRDFYFQVWTPQLKDQVADCVFLPTKNGEKMTDTDVSVTATYGYKPTVFVVYTILTKAVGTSPETVHLYAQELELPSCKAKGRVDLQTEADNVVNDRQDYKYEVIGNSENKIAVAKTWTTETDSAWSNQGHVQVMAITVGEKKATSLQEAQGEEDEIWVASSVTNDTYMILTDKRRVYSIDNNKVLFELPVNITNDDIECSAFDSKDSSLTLYRLSADKYVYNCWGDVGDKHLLDKTYLVTASSGEAIPLPKLLKLSKDNPYNGAYYQQFKDGSLLVTSGDSNQAFHVGTDGTATEILDSAQWERLLHSDKSHFGAVNYLNNQFYVQTTDEILTMDLAGKSVKTLTVEPKIVSLTTDVTKVKWVAWQSPDEDTENSVTLTTGALPDKSENTD